MKWFRVVLVVGLCFLGNLSCGAAENATTTDSAVAFRVRGFNYDFAHRTVDVLNQILDSVELVANQVKLAFEVGLVSQFQLEDIRKFIFTQHSSSLYVGAVIVEQHSGDVIGYIQRNGLIYFSGFNCDPTTQKKSSTIQKGDKSAKCITDHSVDPLGNPNLVLGHVVVGNASGISARFTTTIKHSKGLWAYATPADVLSAGVLYSIPLKNTTGDVFGICSVVLFAAQMDTFLQTNFAPNSTGVSDRVIYIMNENSDLLSASIPNIATVPMPLGSGPPGLTMSVNVRDCTNDIVRLSGLIVESLPEGSHKPGNLIVSDGLLIQQPEIVRDGLKWYAIAVRDGSPTKDFSTTNSTSFSAIIVVSSILTFCMCCLAHTIFYFRDSMRLWRYAHPNWLVVMLGANVMCLLYAIVLMVTPSTTKCILQTWTKLLALTFAASTTLAMIEQVAFGAVTHDAILSRAVKFRLCALGGLVFIQILLIAIQTHVTSSVRVDATFVNALGELEIRKMCTKTSLGLRATSHAIICLINTIGLYRGWKTRSLSALCEESRSLQIVSVQSAILTISILVMDYLILTDDESEAYLWLRAVLMLWYVTTMLMFVYLPRVYRHVTLGDLTVHEMREMLMVKNAKRAKQQQQQQQHQYDVPRSQDTGLMTFVQTPQTPGAPPPHLNIRSRSINF